jgi:hypothetical protein
MSKISPQEHFMKRLHGLSGAIARRPETLARVPERVNWQTTVGRPMQQVAEWLEKLGMSEYEPRWALAKGYPIVGEAPGTHVLEP